MRNNFVNENESYLRACQIWGTQLVKVKEKVMLAIVTV